MKNFVQWGKVLTVNAPYAVSSGDGCQVGALFGVAAYDAAINTPLEMQVSGVFDIKKTSALAIAQGDVLFWNDTAKELNTGGVGTPVAVAVAAAANPSPTVRARLTNSPGVSTALIAETVVVLASAQIKALRAAPATLVPAPGAGKILEFISGSLTLHAGTNVLAETADNLQIKYTDGSGAAVSGVIETTGFIDQAVDTTTFARPISTDLIVASSAGLNKALVLHNTGDGEFTGNAANDATLSIKTIYRVHTA